MVYCNHFEAKKLPETYHIVKFGPYRRIAAHHGSGQTPPQSAECARPNAYLMLLAYMRRQAETIER